MARGRHVRAARSLPSAPRARAAVLTWRDLEARGQALDLLQGASFLYREQNDVIARRVEEASAVPAEVQRRVWEVLAASV
ncbi:MAG: hypothetical protein FJ104_08305 [Deltaproteobacteria bacterium]|nr:hypothetical protein [Deltaproteobacteria bacterium]